MGIVGRLDQYASMLAYEFDETTANNTSITGLGTYFSSEFSENVGIATTITANVFAPYDPVYDEFAGVLYGPGQGRYMRQNTDKSVIVYNEIDEITDFYGRGLVRDGLILDLDAGVLDSYPRSGTAWTDLSGNTGVSTLTNGPTYNSANGGSIVFDGTNDLVSVPTTSLYDFSASRITIEMWFKLGATPDRWVFVSSDASGDPTTWHFGTYTFAEGNFLYFAPGFSASVNILTIPRVATSSLSLNTWYHVVTTSAGNGDVGRMWINGVKQLDGTLTTLGLSYDAGRPIGIGLEPTTGRWPFNGNISVVRIYKNKVFVESEVLQNYNALKGRYGL